MQYQKGFPVGRLRTPFVVGMATGLCVLAISCDQTTIRRSGQVERVQLRLAPTTRVDSSTGKAVGKDLVVTPLFGEFPLASREYQASWGDPIRYAHDVVTVQVHTFHAQNVPGTLTGSRDIAIFAEVWENGVTAFGSSTENTLTSLVFHGQSQLVPSRFNFDGRVAYGPTGYKGHPLRIKFTAMVLQKTQGETAGRVSQVLGDFASAAVPVYGQAISLAARVARDILKAQPDVISFDYDFTLVSDAPEKLSATILDNTKPPVGSKSTSGASENTSTSDAARQRKEEADMKAWFMNRFPYLRYGYFALIETHSRTNGPPVAPGGVRPAELSVSTSNAPPPQKPDPKVDGLPFSPDSIYHLENGRLMDQRGYPLAATYLIFSITPGLKPEDDKILAEASRANLELLTKLQQTDDNVKKSLADLSAASHDLAFIMIKRKLTQEAEKLASKKGMTAKDLQDAIAAKASEYADDLKGERKEAIGEQVKELGKSIGEQQGKIIDDLKPPSAVVSTEEAEYVKKLKSELDGKLKPITDELEAWQTIVKDAEALQKAAAADAKAKVKEAVEKITADPKKLVQQLEALTALKDVYVTSAKTSEEKSLKTLTAATTKLAAAPADATAAENEGKARKAYNEAKDANVVAMKFDVDFKALLATPTDLATRTEALRKFVQ